MPYILGKKIEMTQVFENGKVVPVTLVAVEPCVITQIKTKEKDGYEAVQLGLEKKKVIRVKKSEKGKEYKYLREFRVAFAPAASAPKVGEQIDLSAFQAGDKVRVSGISKGKGFQGAVKRWGFHGRNATHGVKHEHRTLGSVGSTDAARVFPGKKMPGRMGGDRTSVKNLMIMKIDIENNILAIKGAIPGRRGTLLEISNAK
ncbi:50S ribosomal protein L3 [bacterium (Candidatus Gribaldobacteria) CG_4_8_14_3_um_filter_42_11]|uniref:Large ribosomal subunit protein uL3 n=3 Tax=Candidatus Gribaldobacteria TaxID=2798536 RepID=A0A2H0V0G3_9BACT|nr:MAG: 50S ribosomal protein L3 [Parcubacteria group bacterium CG1_02_41_26]PIR91820.1 MAG: 50S ribosomal protein L3 [bacterium (Candidatus Gribaldobacteria) CG10_big_fil_rev_8_21_14_0_10_41_12]PIV46812.1 MAG: 50S ribosomal protein L3 [bacterium (Candidatus Gribaldobacteria) CG02_land_8_20_14_3_00_41_15]PIX02947.1 MAG: 50S ribosomal protein L3 [bacterium (Candidatus Gribaldobacteria) CG_4_8_14_3_um_filter_42_11]